MRSLSHGPQDPVGLKMTPDLGGALGDVMSRLRPEIGSSILRNDLGLLNPLVGSYSLENGLWCWSRSLTFCFFFC